MKPARNAECVSLSRRRGFLATVCLLAFIVLAASGYAAAADAGHEPSIALGHVTLGDEIVIVVENPGSVPVSLRAVFVELQGKRYSWHGARTIDAGAEHTFPFRVPLPSVQGSYAAAAFARFERNGVLATTVDVWPFRHGKPSELEFPCDFQAKPFQEEGEILVTCVGYGKSIELIVPKEIAVLSAERDADSATFRLRALLPELEPAKYPVFAVVSGKPGSVGIAGGSLAVRKPDVVARRGRIPTLLLVAQLLLAAGGIAFRARRLEERATWSDLLMKYSARSFFLAGGYLALRYSADVVRFFAERGAGGERVASVLFELVNHFSGPNYSYFFSHFVDAYWCGVVLLSPLFLWRVDQNRRALDDKYFCAAGRMLPFLLSTEIRKRLNRQLAKVGLRLLGVKLFFLPYLASWSINNVYHQWNLGQSFSLTFSQINAFMMALFILTDTMVYCVGYSFESKRYGSEVRSVDPTILGWVVCLWCYPPFNLASFVPFDKGPLGWSGLLPRTPAGDVVAATLVTIGWGIFAWASLSLGFRGSNLTDRGIVARGPYAFVRHPAYAAKLGVWLVEWLYFERYRLGLMAAFLVVYWLRAWTEERHLGRTPEYAAYKRRVGKRFIPFIL